MKYKVNKVDHMTGSRNLSFPIEYKNIYCIPRPYIIAVNFVFIIYLFILFDNS